MTAAIVVQHTAVNIFCILLFIISSIKETYQYYLITHYYAFQHVVTQSVIEVYIKLMIQINYDYTFY